MICPSILPRPPQTAAKPHTSKHTLYVRGIQITKTKTSHYHKPPQSQPRHHTWNHFHFHVHITPGPEWRRPRPDLGAAPYRIASAQRSKPPPFRRTFVASFSSPFASLPFHPASISFPSFACTLVLYLPRLIGLVLHCMCGCHLYTTRYLYLYTTLGRSTVQLISSSASAVAFAVGCFYHPSMPSMPSMQYRITAVPQYRSDTRKGADELTV